MTATSAPIVAEKGDYRVTITYDPITDRRRPWLVETFVRDATVEGGWRHPETRVPEFHLAYPTAREHWRLTKPARFRNPAAAVGRRQRILLPVETADLLTATRAVRGRVTRFL